MFDDDKFYESSMDQAAFISTEGDISWVEDEQYLYEYPDGEETITLQRGVDFYLDLEISDSNESVNLKWDFLVTYVFLAYEIDELLRFNNPFFQCWISDEWCFDDFVTREVGNEPLSQELIFVDLDVYAIHDGFSVLVRQQAGTDEYHEYWEGINQQKEQSDLFVSPPYNLISNLKAVDH